MRTRLTRASGKRSGSILAGSVPATQAAVPSATAAALPQGTMPHSAPVNSAMRPPAASISSSRLPNCREAASIAARTCGSIRLPPCIVRTLQQLMNGRTPSARYGLALLFMRTSAAGNHEYSRVARSGGGAIPPCRRLRWYFDMQEDKMIWGQKHEGEDRPTVRSDGSGNGTLLGSGEAAETIERLRSGIDQASRAM